jgi:hypothetical protein
MTGRWTDEHAEPLDSLAAQAHPAMPVLWLALPGANQPTVRAVRVCGFLPQLPTERRDRGARDRQLQGAGRPMMLMPAPWRETIGSRIYTLLISRRGQWVGRTELMAFSRCYNPETFHVTMVKLRHKYHVLIESDTSDAHRLGGEARYRLGDTLA